MHGISYKLKESATKRFGHKSSMALTGNARLMKQVFGYAI